MTDTGLITHSDGLSLDRVEKALAFVDRDGLGLEIGPSHCPIAPRRDGFNVHVLDYQNEDDLREKFKNFDVDLSRIEDVDFVSKGEPIRDLVGTDRYDWIIASHVVEHLPDLAGFLNDCHDILKPNGVLSLIVPDKRFIFDHFRPITTTGDILDGLRERRSRATPGNVFDSMRNCINLDGETSWSLGAKGRFVSHYDFETSRERWLQAEADIGYIDCHVTCYTPASFRLILHDLRALGLLNLSVLHEFDTAGNEFFVTLRKGATDVEDADRMDLLRQIEVELAAAAQVEVVPHVVADPEPVTADPLPSAAAPPWIPESRNDAGPVPTEDANSSSVGGTSLSAREEQLIAFKRRTLEKVRGSLRWATERKPGQQ